METIEIEIQAPAEHDETLVVAALVTEPLTTDSRASDALVTDANCSLAMLHAPQAALDAARRLYQRNRAGLRFFCENRRVVPVDQLEALGEFGEGLDAPALEAPALYAVAPSSLSGIMRSTM
ncbi:MAG: hypothetical protein ROZ64_05465 [Burkholderiaceae bacterium]|jgi:hypothetical protein|nr:hypothetical protein [Burkholderiaceae bacterium]